MDKFSVGQKVKIIYCNVREDLSGKETTITTSSSGEFGVLDFSDNYNLPGYHVEIDPDFRPIEDQLELV